jgi:hypothetical protein
VLKEEPVVSPEERARRERQMEELQRFRDAAYRVPTDPNAVYPTAPTNPPTNVVLQSKTTAPSAPGDLVAYRNALPGSGTAGQLNYDPNEPTAAANGRMVLYTGNIYARLSGDHGQNFSVIDPYTTFPNSAGGVGGDFVTYYDRTRGLMIWYLQYFTDANGNNVHRLVVYNGQRNLANNAFTYYDLTPQGIGYPTNRWFDYPDLAVSDNRLYVTTNVCSSSPSCVDAVYFRFDLDELAAGGTANYTYYTGRNQSGRLTTGAGNTMYIGAHVDNNTIRLYSWPEAGNMSSVDRDVTAWQTITSTAPSLDGTDWLMFDGHRIIAAWVAGGRIGFMWDSAQGGGYAQANVRYARFNVSDLNLSDQGAIWNADYAYAYPSAHPNDRGDLGGTINFGGRTGVGNNPNPYPNVAVWVADGFNGGTLAPMTSLGVTNGTNGPGANRWGDYLSTRWHVMYGNTWVGTGFVLNGGTGSANYEPHYIWFGREQDRPPATNTIYVNKFSTTWQSGSAANPYHIVGDGNFAAVSGDTLLIQAGNYNGAVTLDRPSIINTIGGTVVIGAP